MSYSDLTINRSDAVNATTTRFSGAPWFQEVKNTDIMVAGVGGIGSWLVFMLSRLNPHSLTIIDNDVVSMSNMAGQMFSLNDIGDPKVVTMENIVKRYSNYYRVDCYREQLTENTSVKPVLMCGFDNMAARKEAYQNWKSTLQFHQNKDNFLLIDGRLSAEMMQVFCITGNDNYYMKEYEDKWLFDDSEAESTVCSYKQTSYCANMIASLMTNLFVNWCTNRCCPLIDRSLPFKTEYLADQMLFTTEV